MVLNSPHLPFWRATSGDSNLDIVQVNLLHMAVRVPPGSRQLKFIYDRPTFFDVLLTKFDAPPG